MATFTNSSGGTSGNVSRKFWSLSEILEKPVPKGTRENSPAFRMRLARSADIPVRRNELRKTRPRIGAPAFGSCCGQECPRSGNQIRRFNAGTAVEYAESPGTAELPRRLLPFSRPVVEHHMNRTAQYAKYAQVRAWSVRAWSVRAYAPRSTL